jgi:hypothetical protein
LKRKDEGNVMNIKDPAPTLKSRPIILAQRRNTKMARSVHALERGFSASRLGVV